ncbi:MAG: LCP family protein [Clostridiales bacterium]|nr:LCP family protein [Clostridiales bacterium]
MSIPNVPSKRTKLIVRVLLVVLLVLALLVGALYAFVQVKLGAINRFSSGTSDDGDSSTSAVSSWEPTEWAEAGIATSVDGVVNVLLVGQDTRDGERSNSDTMIILSINRNTNQISMVSLMRDIYVQIPGYENNKLNSAYLLGGCDLLDETIATNFGVVIDYNVEVDFTGFKDIVDTLGGIDVEMYQEEADYINGKLKQDTLTEGVNHLTGEEALWYARTRKVGNADFERTERQREVLEIIYEDLKGASWLKLLQVYDSVADNVTTDMTNNQILNIAFSAYSMGQNELNSYRLPIDGTWHSEDSVGSVVDPLVIDDWTANQQTLWSYLYGEDSGTDADSSAETSSAEVSE